MNAQSDTNVRWMVVDPLGKTIKLNEAQFVRHILGAHEYKDAANRAMVESRVQKSIASPRFIIRDQNDIGRRKYLDLVDVFDGTGVKIKTLTIVVDDSDEVITWILKRSINDFLTEGGMIYDAQMV